MKKLVYCLLLPLSVAVVGCSSSEKPTTALNEMVAPLYDSTLRPFYHGVASGDPLADRVIIWTRVTPPDSTGKIDVKWEVSESSDFSPVYKSDTFSTSAARDYTVKVDVGGLTPGQTYFYRFSALERTSMVGRTRTAPVNNVDSLKFAVVSCSNWEWGYFNAYEKIGQRTDVDAVIHLGDYIYEYGRGKYGDTTIRKNLPPHEIVTLQDYRTRHSQYRLDKGLRYMTQQLPLIAIWDDHEVANNAYTLGAQNHQPDQEGEYLARKAVAKKAYYEWIPIREGTKHYRSFSYGPLADILMLDERLEGKTKPVDSLSDPSYNSEDRSMLGTEQLDWLQGKLAQSKATWKVIGNQVMFSDIALNAVYPNMPRNLDSWDGYPAEKRKLRNWVVDNNVTDVLFLTGDTHASWAIEVMIDGQKGARSSPPSIGVELGTTSISSANDNEYHSTDTVKMMEKLLLKDNPHIKYLNARDHGYLLITLRPTHTKAAWYYMNTVREPVSEEFLGGAFRIDKGSPKLK